MSLRDFVLHLLEMLYSTDKENETSCCIPWLSNPVCNASRIIRFQYHGLSIYSYSVRDCQQRYSKLSCLYQPHNITYYVVDITTTLLCSTTKLEMSYLLLIIPIEFEHYHNECVFKILNVIWFLFRCWFVNVLARLPHLLNLSLLG